MASGSHSLRSILGHLLYGRVRATAAAPRNAAGRGQAARSLALSCTTSILKAVWNVVSFGLRVCLLNFWQLILLSSNQGVVSLKCNVLRVRLVCDSVMCYFFARDGWRESWRARWRGPPASSRCVDRISRKTRRCVFRRVDNSRRCWPPRYIVPSHASLNNIFRECSLTKRRRSHRVGSCCDTYITRIRSAWCNADFHIMSLHTALPKQ